MFNWVAYLIGIQSFVTNAFSTCTMASSAANLMRVILNATQVAGILALIVILIVLSTCLVAIFCYKHKDYKPFCINCGNHSFI